ncbi:2OG-Fe(II) oxygenase [Thalassobellus suaedae]|uniref:2OG-Fe(II) oxygenase n=1 Tax=Thalassobellus suaedae TaxID=3074124 RepID=A0ABY9Y7Q0_9FLAO|nr:2OG-Fe(II) oxygenase [Flavobacteriaceae bacterium HL-DH14]WNH14103.1 2OG-Fe(II) oxygenase [Flavobacteriaceae bacterium HL-DH10]
MSHLFESIDFVENPLYEQIISDLAKQQFSSVEHFFSLDEVALFRQSLLEKYEEDAFKKAAIGSKLNKTIEKSIRGDLILWIDETKANQTESLFFSKINDLVTYLNKTCFLGILNKEFHYALYPKDTYYKKHIDTFQNDDRRKLSFVCYLNEDGWLPENGGELVLYLNKNGEETEKVIYPFPGRMVIFESQIIEHEVKPVKTKRMSITGWLKTR